jgi:WhiB family redox-sensing transcriptional regulator
VTTGTAIEAWQREAECRGDQRRYFFPPASSERRDEKERRERHAKALCARCAVRAECLDTALRANETHGIWGGLNELERRHLTEQPVS